MLIILALAIRWCARFTSPGLQLAPGASHRVTLPLSPAELSAYSVTAGAFVSVKGKFRVMVGASADDIRLTSTFTVV